MQNLINRVSDSRCGGYRSSLELTRNARRPLLRTAVAQAMYRPEQSKNLMSAEMNLMVSTVNMSASSMNGLLVLRLLEGGDEDAIPISPDQSHRAVETWNEINGSLDESSLCFCVMQTLSRAHVAERDKVEGWKHCW